MTIIIALLIALIIVAVLFAPANWGYEGARSPLIVVLVICLILFLVLVH